MKTSRLLYIGYILLCGCSLNIPLEDQFSDPDAITDVSSARSLLATAYNDLPQHIFEFAVLSDDFYPSSKLIKDAGLQNLYRWREVELTELADNLWTEYYAVISTINALQNRLDAVTTISPEEESEKNIIACEAKALKAKCYFDLLRLFAPSYPGNEEKEGIILKDQVELDYLPRSSIKKCVTEIRQLLKEARHPDNTPDKIYWLSDYAVTYLQAEVELYTGNYLEVLNLTNELITLFPEETLGNNPYTALWSNETSKARIFAKYQSDQIYQDIRYDPYASGDYLVMNDEITYSPQDKRKTWSEIEFVMDNTQPVRLFGKYNKMNREEIPGMYVNIWRAAGIWLMRAEALARTSKPGAATELMNRFLTQRGAEPLETFTNPEKLLEQILEERRKEFVGEGERYFDLKRCHKTLNKYKEYGNGILLTLQPGDYRWTLPIPASEYRYNEKINQNEGWPKIKI